MGHIGAHAADYLQTLRSPSQNVSLSQSVLLGKWMRSMSEGSFIGQSCLAHIYNNWGDLMTVLVFKQVGIFGWYITKKQVTIQVLPCGSNGKVFA